jgi:hypothetical protein
MRLTRRDAMPIVAILLIADQALVEGLAVVSADAALERFGVERVW